jgi:hypothetical protein
MQRPRGDADTHSDPQRLELLLRLRASCITARWAYQAACFAAAVGKAMQQRSRHTLQPAAAATCVSG